MLFPLFLVYAAVTELATVSMTANAKQVQCKCIRMSHCNIQYVQCYAYAFTPLLVQHVTILVK